MDRSHWAQWFCMNKTTLKAILLMLYGIENFYVAISCIYSLWVYSLTGRHAAILNCTVGALMFSLHPIVSFFLAVPPSVQLYTYCDSFIGEYLNNYSGDIWYTEEFFLSVF